MVQDKLHVPQRYLPKTLSRRDFEKQRRNLKKSRKLYRQGIYYTRPKVSSFRSRKSNHLRRAREIYGVENVKPSKILAKRTQCSLEALEKIVNKGRGAYFSSGSRPNQTAESWGVARLASAITGGNASMVDYSILEEGCKPTSPALRFARRTCKNQDKHAGSCP